MEIPMKKQLLSLLSAAAVTVSLISSTSYAATPSLKPNAVLKCSEDGDLIGISRPVTAEYIVSQFSGDVYVKSPDGVIYSDAELVASGSHVMSADGEIARITVPADVNSDGSITLADVTFMLKSLAGWDIELYGPAADIDGNGELGLADVTVVLKYIAGWKIALAEPLLPNKVIYQDEVENNMNVYTIKTFNSADEVVWDTVTAASVNNYKWVECETYETWAQLVYIKDWGFLCRMTCLESFPAATYKNFADPVCLDSCMEFFAIWYGDTNYLNIESNSIGTMCIQYGASRESRRDARRHLKLEDMFVMNPSVENGYWTLTMEIPIEKLQAFYGKGLTADTFVSGYSFTGNFYKTGGADITGNEHYAMWNEVMTENPDFHRPEYFGKFIME